MLIRNKTAVRAFMSPPRLAHTPAGFFDVFGEVGMRTVALRVALRSGAGLAVLVLMTTEGTAAVTDLVLSKSANNVELHWTTGTTPYRVIRSRDSSFISGNASVAQGVVTGNTTDPNALSPLESYFYQVLDSNESNPPLYDLNLPRPVPVITMLTPDSVPFGPAPTLVTIDGLNFAEFGSGQIVMFGNTLVEVVSASPTQIVVLIPPETATSDAVVCVFDNCSNAVKFTVTVGSTFENLSSLAFEPGTGSLWLADRGTTDKVIEIDNTGNTHIRATFDPQFKVTASDAQAADNFGRSLAISGDTVIIGATESGVGTGSAYVFVRSGSSWMEQQKLTASDATAGDLFGGSVAIDGNTAIVGAFGEDSAGHNRNGAAYVFVRSGSTWTQQQKLTASDPRDIADFGWSVTVQSNTVIIGAPGDSELATSSGAAYVFTRSGTTWTQQQKLTASDPDDFDNFGFAVHLDDEYGHHRRKRRLWRSREGLCFCPQRINMDRTAKACWQRHRDL